MFHPHAFPQTGAVGLMRIATFLLVLPIAGLAGPPRQEAGAAPDAATVSLGREVFALACVQCHGPSQAMIQRKPAEGWRRTIYSMIARRAPVLPDEIEPLTAYLTSVYGPASPPPVFAGGTIEPAPLPAGGEMVMGACGACHAVNLVFDSRKSESAWRETVDQMRALGANLTDSEQQLIVRYLAEHFGPE